MKTRTVTLYAIDTPYGSKKPAMFTVEAKEAPTCYILPDYMDAFRYRKRIPKEEAATSREQAIEKHLSKLRQSIATQEENLSRCREELAAAEAAFVTR